jgi:hypothetical protein
MTPINATSASIIKRSFDDSYIYGLAAGHGSTVALLFMKSAVGRVTMGKIVALSHYMY